MKIHVVGGEPAVAAVVARVAEELSHEVSLDPKPGRIRGDDAVVDLGATPNEVAAAPDPVAAEQDRAARLARSLPPECRLVRVSLLGATAESGSWLKRAQAAAETALKGRGVVLRVGILLGECGLVAAVKRRVERAKIFPVPGAWHARFEPLDVEDLGRYCVEAATSEVPLGERYDLGCGEMITGGLLVRDLAENLGLERWVVPAPALARGPVARWLATPELPAKWIAGVLEALPDLLPRRMGAWDDFTVRPIDLRQAFARAVGMSIPLRRRAAEGERFAWKRPTKKGILWTKRR